MADKFGSRRSRHNSRARLAKLVVSYRPQSTPQPLIVSCFRAAHGEPVQQRRKFDVAVRVTHVRGSASTWFTAYPDYVGK